ncbi:MAG: hypothetical protein M1813_000095 [Trichoglossum hirsutum]|nr:MAG: hypothetical protein M1813_000095 [Trichoglossum hirsutum]
MEAKLLILQNSRDRWGRILSWKITNKPGVSLSQEHIKSPPASLADQNPDLLRYLTTTLNSPEYQGWVVHSIGGLQNDPTSKSPYPDQDVNVVLALQKNNQS